jgi:hypothetical protein
VGFPLPSRQRLVQPWLQPRQVKTDAGADKLDLPRIGGIHDQRLAASRLLSDLCFARVVAWPHWTTAPASGIVRAKRLEDDIDDIGY